jgi:hypothetical protein
MAKTSYTHADLGFGFDVPDEWRIELESSSQAFPAIVALRQGEARIMIAARRALIPDLLERAANMRRQLDGRGIEAIRTTELPAFPNNGNVVALEFALDGVHQRWLSLVADDIEFSFTHTQTYDAVRTAVARIAATFRPTDRERTARFLAAWTAATPAAQAAAIGQLSDFERLATRFHVPLAPTRRGKS